MIRRAVLPGALGLVVCLFVSLLFAGPAAAAVGPKWKLTVTPNADYFIPGQHPGVYKIEAENAGDKRTSKAEPITLEDIPPAGTTALTSRFYDLELGSEIRKSSSLAPVLCPSTLTCVYPEKGLAPGQRLVMTVLVQVEELPSGLQESPLEDVATVSGGGAPPAQASATNAASPNPPFGLLGFDASLPDASGNPYTQAGGHPYQFTTEFNFETFSSAERFEDAEGRETNWDLNGTSPVRDPRAISVDLPPGLLANPQSTPHCSLAEYFAVACSLSKDAVGDGCFRFFGITEGCSVITPIFNLQPEGFYPAELGMLVGNAPFVLITAGIRSGSDYGATATAFAQEVDLTRVRVTLWGVPADPSHNALRGKECQFRGGAFESSQDFEHICEGEPGSSGGGGQAGVPDTPLLTMPTECSGEPLPILGRYDTWDEPAEYASRTVTLPAVDGCNQLKFEPEIREARPTTNLADAPSGFDFNLRVPQGCWEAEEAPGFETLCQADLKEAVVKLPPGLVVNPSSGAGLAGCSPAQVGLSTGVGVTPAHFSEEPAHCPDAAKLGTVEVRTPLLHDPLQGSVYLATPRQNPTNSLLAGYIVLEGEGLIIKLAGQFHADLETGQITASFLENPQTPFEEFKFHFFEGARGALRTPAVCGSYEVGSTLTPYSFPESGPAAEPTAEFEIAAGPGGEGSPCPSAGPAEEPNHPVFHAGTESPQAGAYSPFSLRLVRSDGEQEITGIDTTLPPGLVGKLAGVAECSDSQLAAAAAPGHSGAAEQDSPSCPSSSELGSVDVAAGAGPTPLNVAGHAYLAGPYKGAPLSLAIITPAVAGPFDLGTVVVRTALFVDPFTAQIHAVSDPIPTILEGIPLDVRSVTLKMSRPDFTLNPTNCEPLAFTGSALSVLGQRAPLSQRFQVGGCPALKFKPGLRISLKGGTKRHHFPALKAVVTYPKKGAFANIASAQVTLPHSAFLEQGHIRTVCTRPQLASHTCPAKSIYGHATAVTPLLDKPLSGPVYLGVGFGHKLPDLVADLNGQIEVLLHGKVDTGREDGLRNTFEVVPDAPVSKFTLSMFGGKKGLIVNSENLCGPRAKTKALARFSGQNGKTYEVEPTVANSCKKKGKGKHRKHHRKAAG